MGQAGVMRGSIIVTSTQAALVGLVLFLAFCPIIRKIFKYYSIITIQYFYSIFEAYYYQLQKENLAIFHAVALLVFAWSHWVFH